MAINALAFSSQLPFSTSMQRERLSSSFQVSTCGLVELGISEPKVSCFGVQQSKPTRLAGVRTHISTDSKGLSRNSFFHNKRTIHKASRRLQFCKNDSAIHNQLQWKPFLYGVFKKKELGERTFFSSRGITFDENIDVTGSAHVEPQKEGNIEVAGSAVEPQKVGILLLNLGGPDTLKDVQPFLYNLFADPDIIRLPRFFQFLQRPLAKLISILRAPKSREGYAAIGGGSPLRKITDEQADALRLALEAKKVLAKVYVGMRYWYPFTEEAIEQIKKDGINKLVVLPLYPQFSISTSGSSIRLLESIFREDNYLVRLQYVIIASWYQRKGYIKAMANLMEKELQCFSRPEKAMIFFSAHGVPVTYIDAGDPYKTQMEECVGLIMEELKNRGIDNEYTLAYQSRVGPVEWLKPYTDEAIIQLGQKGVKNLLAVPISFVSEHIETLEEIDMEYKELALKSGIENWGRVPALGCEPAFISDLADAVIEALPNVEAMAESNTELEQVDKDFVKLIFAMFFGSILAFLLVVGPKVIRAFINCKSKLPSNVFPKF